MRRSRLWWLSVAVSLTSCASFGDLLIFGPRLIKPASLPGSLPSPPLAIMPASAPPGGRLRVQAEYYLDGVVTRLGTPVAQAPVQVVDLQDGRALGSGETTDATGHLRVTLTAPVTHGSLLAVTVQAGETDLVGLVQADTGPTGSGPIHVGHAAISLASTLVLKRVLPKLAEVMITDSGTPDSRRRLVTLADDTDRLIGEADRLMADVPADDRVRRALLAVQDQPDNGTIDALATTAVQYSPLRQGVGAIVADANTAVLANIREGGAVVSPSLWQVGYFTIEPPIVRRSGYDTVMVSDGAPPVTILVHPEAFDRGEDRRPVVATWQRDLHNAPPPPPVSGGGGGAIVAPPVIPLLVFTSTSLHANADVFSIRLDGTGVSTLTNDLFADQFPVINKQGTKIALIANNGGNKLTIIDTDGSGRQQLGAAIAVAPVWSPDGTRVAYVSFRDGNSNLYVYNLLTATDTRLTAHVATDWNPAWSPDGQWIAFSSDRNGGPNIYVIKPDGTGEAQVSTDPIADDNPNWSPDSQWIVFNAKRDMNLYKIRPNGTGEVLLANTPGEDLNPKWSPDGQWIAYTNNRTGNDNIYVIKPDGTGEIGIATSAGQDRSPVWTADSQYVVFVSNRAGQYDLYSGKPDGSGDGPVAVRAVSAEQSPSVF